MALVENKGRVRAVLGPTNTGKTYLAIERMLGHATGMIGFPLRLLARENYDRIVALKGRRTVALITGEEKIIPPRPRWFVCTVESMPLDRQVDFLAIDEIQLCADRERGHIFTDRLLHARGREETMFLGSDTIAPLLRRLVPEAQIETRPRFSTLSYAGAKKLTRLPRRSAIVAFSLNEVYGLAEMVRRHRGGTAVVLGALSPRTRNAQVAMYQAGEVDYMVATDAIGMGLNMEIEHVAFAGMRKYDGERPRRLLPAEIGQIAGRAGRYQHDGTFGVTNDIAPFDEDLVMAIEGHHYDTIDRLCWRNRDLDFGSPQALVNSLSAPPPVPVLYRARDGEDFDALKALCTDAEVKGRATNPAAVRILWDVCQIPDFRKVMPDIHVRLLRRVFLHLTENNGRLPDDWMRGHLDRLDNIDGDIDTLTQRIAHVRTWTYISHRAEWLADSAQWQARARQIEDRLSDALHERLLQRFVDRRAPVMAKQRQGEGNILSYVDKAGEVIVEGVCAGRVAGLRFLREGDQSRAESRMLVAAARPTIAGEIDRRVVQLVQDSDKAFSLSRGGRIRWNDVEIAWLQKGDTLLTPEIVLLRSEFLTRGHRGVVIERLGRWLGSHLRHRLQPLFALRDAELGGAARGLAFQLVEGLGTVLRADAQAQIAALDAVDRKALTHAGVRFGAHGLFLAPLLRPQAQRLRAILAAVHAQAPAPQIGRAPSVPANGTPSEMWRIIGFRVLGDRAIRYDNVERLAAMLRKQAKHGAFTVDETTKKLAGCDGNEFAAVMAELGYRETESESGPVFEATMRGGKPKRNRQRKRRGPAAAPDSPFAKLRDMAFAR
jgi:ATP-dependent RNA helicase SUPV3L1/SUV3